MLGTANTRQHYGRGHLGSVSFTSATSVYLFIANGFP